MQVARSLGWFDEAELTDLQLAAGEGIANAIEHGFQECGFFELRCYVVDTAYVIEVEDFGRGIELDPAGVPHGRENRDRGFGVEIISETVDSVQFVRLETGTLLRLTKRGPLSSRARFGRSDLFENLRRR